jgi:hypothetical protein
VRQRNALLTWWAASSGTAGITCGLARTYATLAGWQYDAIVLVLGWRRSPPGSRPAGPKAARQASLVR